jgi:DNA-binding MarR family transcriptional regulator
MSDDPLTQLYGRPGFMLRRAHQIAVSVFLEQTSDLRITTTQYGILFLLCHQPGIDQITVAKLLGLDRSTTAMVVKKLETDGLVGRSVGAGDRRRRALELTTAGAAMLKRLKAPASRARERLLSVLAPSERATFLRLLDKFTQAFNESARVPLLMRRPGPEQPRKPARKNKASGRL